MRKIFILAVFLSLCSCSKDDDGTSSSLPGITSEGLNTFGCKIDGITFLPRSSGNIFSGGTRTNLSAKYRYYENQYYSLGPGYHLAIRAYNSQTNKSISIELTESDEPLISGMTILLF